MSANSLDEGFDSDASSSLASEASVDGKSQPRRLIFTPDKSESTNNTDLMRSLRNAFWTSEHVFEGKFWWKADHNYPLNPMIQLDGFGGVTLPLGPAEAKSLISHCKQALFGMGEQTVADTTVRNTWEIDASGVHIENPEWQGYLGRQLERMCSQLGVDFKTTQPRCELYKLLVYETGSHFLPHRDSIKVDGMFASMIVVLPSEFSGGAVHLTHGEKTTVLDSSPQSSTNTLILAWFADIMHEVKPITSGYRLALSYNIIQAVQTLRPFFVSSAEVVGLFRTCLVTWKEREDATPFKVVVLLAHQYSRATLCGGALKGSDAQVVGLLKDLGEELGFCLGLATAEYYTNRSVNGDDYIDGGLKIKSPVDLDGKSIDHLAPGGFHCDKGEMIPSNMEGDIGEGACYKEREYERGNEGQYEERWYRRTVLLLWPERHNVELECGANFQPIFKALKDTVSRFPSKEECRATDYLVRAVLSKRVLNRMTLRSVCHAAACWGDLGLWQRIVTICRGDQGFGHLTDIEVSEAVRQFGFANVQTTIEKALAAERDNLLRFQILEKLEHCWDIGQTKDIPVAWIRDQHQRATESLKAPRWLDELPLFLDLIQKNQSDPLLRARILSQLKSLARPELLLHFACLLHVEKHLFVAWDDSGTTFDSAVRDILSTAISRAQFYEPYLPPHHEEDSTLHPKRSVGPELAHLYLLSCLKTGNEDLGGMVVEELVALVEQERIARFPMYNTMDVIAPLVLLLANTHRAYPGLSSVPGIEKFYVLATELEFHERGVLGFAAAVWLAGDDGLVEKAKLWAPHRIKPEVGILVRSVLPPWQEAWRPTLERLLELVNSKRP